MIALAAAPRRIAAEPESHLYALIDELASLLDRSVVVESAAFDLVGHSRQRSGADAIRLETILHRRVADDVREHLTSLGLDDLPAPVRVPAAPALGMQSRVCVPLRDGTTLLGYLWILDPDERLAAERIGELEGFAEQLALAWPRASASSARRRFESQLLGRVLYGTPGEALHARRELEALRILAGGEPVVVYLTALDGAGPGEGFEPELVDAFEEVRSSLRTRDALYVCGECEGVLVTAASLDTERIAGALRELAEARTRRAVGVGVSGAGDLSEVHRLADCARAALRVGRRAAEHGAVARWDDLGVYQLLSAVPGEVAEELVHPGLRALLAKPANRYLLETLECFLDNAGDVKRTAEQLVLHRTTLYYRLRKAEEVAGVDLRHGGDRLGLHIGLKLARLTGAYRPATGADPASCAA